MEENPPVGGFILCHQSIKGKQVVRQMRPLTDWSKHTWYTEASLKPVSKKVKAAAKKKANKSKSKKGIRSSKK